MSDEVRATPRESGLREDDEISEVWAEFKSTGDGHLRNRLIERYLYLVKVIANRIAARLPRSIDVQDLRSAGVFGLIRAIENFDTSRGTRFESYCATRVHGAILDELRAQDWVPRLVRNRADIYRTAFTALRANLDRDPCTRELAVHLGLARRRGRDAAPREQPDDRLHALRARTSRTTTRTRSGSSTSSSTATARSPSTTS